ncbi:hypothetical protein D9M70_568630 [compost metagenome]
MGDAEPLDRPTHVDIAEPDGVERGTRAGMHLLQPDNAECIARQMFDEDVFRH